ASAGAVDAKNNRLDTRIEAKFSDLSHIPLAAYVARRSFPIDDLPLCIDDGNFWRRIRLAFAVLLAGAQIRRDCHLSKGVMLPVRPVLRLQPVNYLRQGNQLGAQLALDRQRSVDQAVLVNQLFEGPARQTTRLLNRRGHFAPNISK